MQNEYANRQNMHLTVLTLLGTAEYQPVWKNKKPAAFTARAAEFEAKVNALTTLISNQQAATTGFAADKEREEQELESAAHEIGQALAGWFEDQGRAGDAAQVDLSLSASGIRNSSPRPDSSTRNSPRPSLRMPQPSPITVSMPRMPHPSPRKPTISRPSSPIPPPLSPAAARSPSRFARSSAKSASCSPKWIASSCASAVTRPAAALQRPGQAARTIRDLGQAATAAPAEPAPPAA